MLERSTRSMVDVEEWRRWRAGPHGTKCWSAWTIGRPALLGWGVDDLLAPVSSPRTDAMQAALVDVAQHGEGRAATTLLVQLRPALVRLARWTTANGLGSSPDATDEVRAVFFETIYRHSLERRPAKIAANLVLDTRQRISRSLARTARDERTSAAGPDEICSVCSEDPGLISELLAAAALRAAVGRLPGSESSRNLTATLAYRAWILDEPRTAIAADLGLRTSAVSKRLHRLRAVVRREDLTT